MKIPRLVNTMGAQPVVVAWCGLFAVTVIWGIGWMAMKVALNYSGPFAFSMWRYIVGTMGIFALLAMSGESLKPVYWGPTLIVGLTQTAGFQTLVQCALVAGGVGKTTLLAYTMPFWVVLLAWLGLREPLGRLTWLCILAAATGFTLIVQPWQHLGAPLSIALAVSGGFSWAIAVVVAKHFFMHHPEASLLRFTAWQMLFGTCALIIVYGLAHEAPIVWTVPYFIAVIYNGLLSSALGWFIWAIVIKRLPASVASLTSLAVPALVVLLAWSFLGERPRAMEAAGIVMIFTALLALNFIARPRQQPANRSRRAVR